MASRVFRPPLVVVAGMQGVPWHCTAQGAVGMAPGTHRGPVDWLWHHVHTRYHIMGPPFLILSLNRFNASRGWKEKTEDNNDPKDTTAEKFLGSLLNKTSVWVTGMMSLPPLT